MRAVGVSICLFATVFFTTACSDSPQTSQLAEAASPVLDKSFSGITPPIHKAPNENDGFVLRDKNISAFFKDSGVALSISHKQPANPYAVDTVHLGIPDRGLFGTTKRLDDTKPVYPATSYRLGVHWGLVGARAVEPQPEDMREARINYLVGDQSKWKTGLPSYSRVAYRDVYPGVDLVIGSRNHGIKYSLYGRPGADLRRIRLRYSGAGEIRIVEGGKALEIHTALGVLLESELKCYQVEPTGMKKAIKARYVSARAGSTGDWEYEIELDGYDPRFPVFVDPVIEWSSFLGGGGDPGIEIHGSAVALDSSNNVYLTGMTRESDFPATAGFSPDNRGYFDAYVVKVDESGSFLVWASYLGGSNVDEGFGIAVDDVGCVYVCGRTTSTDFPATGSPGPVLQGTGDAFVTKINADGASLAWSFYLGGTQWEVCHSIQVDANRDVYLGGRTVSDDFPVVGGFQPVFGGQQDGFIAKVDKSGSSLLWSTYLGGAGFDMGTRIAVDSSGNAYFTGTTMDGGFPVVGGFDNTPDGFTDAFVTKVDSTGSAIVYSSYLGGNNSDDAYGIAVDSNGNAIVVGATVSDDFPTNGGFDTTKGGSVDAFVTKVSVDGSALDWSSYLGGSANDEAQRVAVDGSGNIYVSGYTKSADYPSNGGFDTTLGGTDDGVVTKIMSNGNQIIWSSYIGGGAVDWTTGITVDNTGNVYLLGTTESSDLPVPGGFDTDLNGIRDGFVAKVDASGSSLVWSSYLGAGYDMDLDLGYGIAVDGSGNAYVTGATLSGNFPTVGGLDSTLESQEAFVSKVSADGTTLEWSTFLGGSSFDGGEAIAVDGSGDVYVVGETFSDDFPLVGGFDSTYSSGEAFVAKITSDGSSLVWSSYLGGTSTEFAEGVTLDSVNNVYVTGLTTSDDFPTPGCFDCTLGGLQDAFVTKVNSDGASLAWSSYLGGDLGEETGFGIAVDGSSNVYIAGSTNSGDFPAPGGFDAALGGLQDAFVAKVSSDGQSLLWSSYLGGDGDDDLAWGIAVDSGQNVYVSGRTDSSDFPTTGGFQTVFGGGTMDAFVTKVNAVGSSLAWSSYLGGADYEMGTGVAIDGGNNVYVTGRTGSADFPVPGGCQTSHGGGTDDAFVAKVNAAGSSLTWSSYLGGSGVDIGWDIDVDLSGDAYVVGETSSRDFPVMLGYDSSLAGQNDIFVMKIDSMGTNTSPVANAGWDFGVPRSIQFYLNGTASFDLDGDPLTYSWLQTGGTPVVLSDNTSPTPDFSVPMVLVDEVFTFQLTVHDGTVASQPDSVDIHVFACLDQPNGAPCGDQGVMCLQNDSCDGLGNCIDAGLQPNGTLCDDSDLCTQTDDCQAGACIGSNPVVCTPLDQCHDAGICNPGTGICTDPTKPDGELCDDSDLCTQTDTCQAGVCTGSNPVTCTALDQCHDVGICNPTTGNCPDPPKADGSACNDGNNCSSQDTCQGGICTAGSTDKDSDSDGYFDASCPGGDDCDDGLGSVNQGASEGPAGDPTCTDTHDNDCDTLTDLNDPACIECEFDTDCDDANACTNDTCSTGVCTNSPVVDGLPCDDLVYCTDPDTCQAGACTGPARDCSAFTDACNDGVCIESPPRCEAQPANDGAGCDDGQYCTVSESCSGGSCTGSQRVCDDLDPCTTDFCDEANDRCDSQLTPIPNAEGPRGDPTCSDGIDNDCDLLTDMNDPECVLCANDGQCNDGNPCTVNTCVAQQCVTAGVPDGSGCNDGLYCTENDECRAGVCQGDAADCSGVEDQCNDGVCNESLDQCDRQPLTGNTCDDADPCRINDTCQNGVCQGEDMDCTHSDGECVRGECADGACGPVSMGAGASCAGCYRCSTSAEGTVCDWNSDLPGRCREGECRIPMARCDSADNCVIEGYCDQPVDGCGLPVVYGNGPGETLNCRLPEGKVGVKVKMEPASAGVGSFQPVRVYLTNTPVDNWRKCVYELRLALEFNPEGDGKPPGAVAYVLNSAILQGGAVDVEEVVDEANQRVILILGGEDDCLPAPGDGGLWVLDFLLVRGTFEDGWFKVNVWAPCDSPNEVMGCHADAGAAAEHRVSATWYSSTSGKSFKEGEVVGHMLRSQALGCQCGSKGGGWLFGVLMLLAWRIRANYLKRANRDVYHRFEA